MENAKNGNWQDICIVTVGYLPRSGLVQRFKSPSAKEGVHKIVQKRETMGKHEL